MDFSSKMRIFQEKYVFFKKNKIFSRNIEKITIFINFPFVDSQNSACNGDIGGPAVVYNSENVPTLVGIVSGGGHGCAIPNYPGVYVKVLAERDWIERHTGI